MSQRALQEQVADAARLVVEGSLFEDVANVWADGTAAAEKGEFETTAEADARRNEFYARLRFLDLTDLPRGSGPAVERAARIRESEPRTTRVHYDMDRRALMVRVARNMPGRFPIRIVAAEDATKSTYTGSNAFGVRSKIDRVAGDYFVLDLVNLQLFVPREDRVTISEIDEDWFAALPMDPGVAKDRMDFIRLLAVGRIEGKGGCRLESLQGEPTIFFPKDVDYTMHVTAFRLAGLVAYDAERKGVLSVLVAPPAPTSGR